MKKIITSVALATLLAGTSAFAADQMDKSMDKQQSGAAANSGPGVQGPADTRTGPSTKGMEGDSGSAASGTSTGEAGTGNQTGPGAGSTSPSQDASGVAGAPGNKNGPSAKEPSDKDAPGSTSK